MDSIVNASLKNIKQSIRLKGILTVLLLSVTLGLMLFMPYISYADNSIDFKVKISGIEYLLSSFKGGYNYSSPDFGNLYFGYNTFFTICSFIYFGSLLGLLILSIIMFFIKKKSAEWVSYLIFGNMLFSMIYYAMFLIGKSFKALGIEGELVPFYRLFEFGISILICMAINLVTGLICKFIRPTNIIRVKKYLPLYLFLTIPFSYILIFSIYPIFLQIILSFKNYNMAYGVFQSEWVGFGNFKMIFTDSSMLRMVGNTIFISVCRMILGILPPLLLAIFLFDLGLPRYRKVVQTIIYIPHFFSWVIIFAIAYAFVNQEGIINNIIVALGGKRITFFNNDNMLYPLLFITDLWKELGWGTILYLAALSGVDPVLYEAASVDGAGAMQKLFKITIPSIAPTIVFVSIMAIGNILKGAGGEQILLFGTDAMASAQTIDTWVVWQGLGKLQYGLSSAVSFIQSAIGLIMVLICNHFSKKYTNLGIW